MGCDIHAFIEYYDSSGTKNNRAYYFSEVVFGRCYTLFNLMAGVRGINPPIFPTKGLPVNPEVSLTVFDMSTLLVSDNSSQYQQTITKEDADSIVSRGHAEYATLDRRRITNPDIHDHSWLNIDELIEIRRRFLLENIHFDNSTYKGTKLKTAEDKIRTSDPVELMRAVFPSIEYPALNATIAAMIALEKSEDYKTRLVFWFDS